MISFNDNTISGGEFFNNSTISGNNINYTKVNITSEIDYNQLKELLCSAFANAQNTQEKECASQATELCSKFVVKIRSH